MDTGQKSSQPAATFAAALIVLAVQSFNGTLSGAFPPVEDPLVVLQRQNKEYEAELQTKQADLESLKQQLEALGTAFEALKIPDHLKAPHMYPS